VIYKFYLITLCSVGAFKKLIIILGLMMAWESNFKRDKREMITYKNGKLIPLEAYGAQRVLGKLRLPDSVTSALESGRLSAIRTGRLYPQDYPSTHFKRLSRPRAHGIVVCHGKNPH
jgi:hypothetical protein